MKFTNISSTLILRPILVLFSTAMICLSGNEIFAQSGPGAKVVPVIELKGVGFERGLQYGTILKNEIAEIFLKWKRNSFGNKCKRRLRVDCL
jgi:hypothetical protein